MDDSLINSYSLFDVFFLSLQTRIIFKCFCIPILIWYRARHFEYIEAIALIMQTQNRPSHHKIMNGTF